MKTEEMLSNLLTFMTSIDVKEIADLDIACQSVIKRLVGNPSSTDGTSFIKLQAILDYTYERINVGSWKDVKSYLRKAMTIVSYLKLLVYFKIKENVPVTENIMKEAFQIIDYGLLFGCPIDSEPKLLQNCATFLNKEYEQMFKLNHKTECNDNLSSKSLHHLGTSGTTKEIEYINCPSMEIFYTNFILKEKPVVLTNCINHWPALTKWQDVNYLLKLAGLRTVPIELGSKYTDEAWTQKLMTLEDFIKTYISGTNQNKGYLAQYQLFEHIPELLKDISEPEYCCFSETGDAVDINAWYGPGGTVSPLHHDPKRNLLAQVVGQKNIFIFSPSDSDYLYPHKEELLSNTARVDPREPDLEKYPKYREASPLHCTLKSGQILYIPPKWWHFVESLSISFSVSFWWT